MEEYNNGPLHLLRLKSDFQQADALDEMFLHKGTYPLHGRVEYESLARSRTKISVFVNWVNMNY